MQVMRLALSEGLIAHGLRSYHRIEVNRLFADS